MPFDPPPDLPEGYGAWQTFDLSTAVFFDSVEGAGGTTWGRYDAIADRILTNIGYPEFYFADFVLDPANEYYFQFVYDFDDGRHGLGQQDAYVSMVDLNDPETSYWNGTYPYVYNNDDEDATAYHLFHLGPDSPNWAFLSGVGEETLTLPVFTSALGGVLAEIRWAALGDVVPPEPPVFVDRTKRARVRFWGQ